MGIRAMQLETYSFTPEKPMMAVFHTLPHKLLTRDTEKAGVEVLLRSKVRSGVQEVRSSRSVLARTIPFTGHYLCVHTAVFLLHRTPRAVSSARLIFFRTSH